MNIQRVLINVAVIVNWNLCWNREHTVLHCMKVMLCVFSIYLHTVETDIEILIYICYKNTKIAKLYKVHKNSLKKSHLGTLFTVNKLTAYITIF